MPVTSAAKAELQSTIPQHMDQGATVCTDEHASDEGLDTVGYQHGSVKHTGAEDGGANHIHVNLAGSIWAVFKRSLFGPGHHCAREHLMHHLNEDTFVTGITDKVLPHARPHAV